MEKAEISPRNEATLLGLTVGLFAILLRTPNLSDKSSRQPTELTRY